MLPVIIAPPRVLIVRFHSMGGVLLTTPLIRAIRARHPSCDIMVLTERRYAPLVSANPHVTEVVETGRRRGVRQLASHLRRQHFTHLLDLQRDARSLVLRGLVRGHWGLSQTDRVQRLVMIRTKRNLYHEVLPLPERFFAAARDLEVTPDTGPPELFLADEAVEQAKTWLEQAGVPSDSPFIAMAPGASRATRRWPPEYFVNLVKKVTATGAYVVIVGGANESKLASEIALRAGPHAASAAGALGLQATGGVLKRAAALIAGDTGLLHLGTAVGTPVVAIFGPTVRQFGWFPYQAHASVVERDLACRPCSSRGTAECPLKHHQCMKAIKPDDVFNVMARILAGATG